MPGEYQNNLHVSAQFPLLPHQSWWKERYAYCKMSVYFLNNVNLFLWSLVNSFNLYCLMGNGSWCWCQFLFCVKLDCSVATSTPSGFWLSFLLNICDKWVLTVNFSSSNVVLFHPMNVATNHIQHWHSYDKLSECLIFFFYNYKHVYGSSFLNNDVALTASIFSVKHHNKVYHEVQSPATPCLSWGIEWYIYITKCLKNYQLFIFPWSLSEEIYSDERDRINNNSHFMVKEGFPTIW